MITLQSKMAQILFAVSASMILGWLSFTVIPGVSLPLVLFACIAVSAGLFVMAQYRQFFWKSLSLHHFFLIMMIAASFLGSAFLTVSAGPIMLFPYRIFLVLLSLVLIYKWLNKDI